MFFTENGLSSVAGGGVEAIEKFYVEDDRSVFQKALAVDNRPNCACYTLLNLENLVMVVI